MSESSQQQLQWWKDKYQYYPITGSYIPHSSPLLSDQDQEEEDQIKTWLCFPSDSNRDNNAMLFGADWNNKQTMEGSNAKICVRKAHDVDAVTVPSNSMAKGNEIASTSKKVGSSHAAKVLKKTKERQGVKSGYQVAESGSAQKKKDIADPPGILPKRLRPPEVHRQSERMRRGKINEKIKALQQLIPRCSKLDKASTLDKTIGYVKDLQMQVRMMSCGYDMGMQMFPGMPQAPMSSMFTDMNVPALPASMDPGRMCLGPSMIPYALTPPYPAPPVYMPYQHNMASSSTFQCPQVGNPSAFPFIMQGRYQM